jgi:uncharacterized protein (UPF0548 family)
MPIQAGRPDSHRLQAVLESLCDQPLTYHEAGATAWPTLPPGYHHEHVTIKVGFGDDVWTRAKEGVRRWEAHRFARATITPEDACLNAGANVVVTLRIGPAFVIAPCRIVYVTDEEDRFGFAYGTLPGHPEQGEEAFHASRSDDQAIWFEIIAFSRPATALSRLGDPLARAIQSRVTRHYLEGMRHYVAYSP